MVYLLSVNITYIIILATCFDSYESSSGINFKTYCTYCFTVLCPTVFVQFYVQYFSKIMPEDDS